MENFDKAMRLISLELINSIQCGEEIQLSNGYVLYKYVEDDIIVLVNEEEWEEEFQIMTDGDEIIYECLT